MADPKKDAKKPDKGGGGGGVNLSGDIEAGIFILLVVAVLFVVLYGVLRAFGISDANSFFLDTWVAFKTWLAHFLVTSINTLTFLSIFFTIMFIMGAYYAKFRRKEIVDELKHKDNQKFDQASGSGSKYVQNSSSGLATVTSAGTEQWNGIEKYMQSQNPSDWRLAILEADILLYDMLEQIGFQGDTIAEKLKSVDPASFNTLDDAWRAHKVRNNLAHEGASYELTYDEARKTIGQFKKVFDEFYFI